jgi:hypothetical protein
MFTPFYSGKELEKLLRHWVMGSLDGIASRGHALLGVVGCDANSRGMRSQNLLERFSSAEVSATFEAMARAAEPLPTYASLLVFKHLKQVPIQDLARGLGYRDSSSAQSALLEAQDTFVDHLFKQSVQP